MKTEEKVLTFFLLGIVCFMMVLTFGYRPGSRLVPQVIGFCTLALMIILCMMVISPKFASWYQRVEGKSPLMGMSKELIESGRKVDQTGIKKREISVAGWLLFLTAVTYILGFLVAIPLFLFLFLKLWAKEGWGLSLCMSGVVLGAVFFIFAYILQIPLHEGIIFG
ncbi:MAG: tripartite tricarboxylate transporter TctB family protein [Thermodesulfobacteriota bacterium]